MRLLVLAQMIVLMGGTCLGTDFDSEIVPLLTKAGCNSGACHGAAAGRGGFHLSLLGADPAFDYESIVQAYEGRRINLAHPDLSLLVRKPTGQLEHGGDVVLEEESLDAQRLMEWISHGASRTPRSPLKQFSVTPSKLVLEGVSSSTSLQAIAVFEDETSTDVTGLTVFVSTDKDAVSLVTHQSKTTAVIHRAGQHVITARYMNRVQAIQLSLPFSPTPLDLSRETRTNFIDDQVFAVLSELRIPVSPQATDEEWLRRVTLDLTGRLPLPEVIADRDAFESAIAKERYVDTLLASEAFTDYWTLLFSKWLRLHSLGNEMQPLQAYSEWLRSEIKQDRGLDSVATQLLTATGDSHAVGPANFARMVADPRDHAELVGQFFMGRQLGCANCHNHPLDRWTQDDYHGLAAVFAKLDRGKLVQITNRGSVTNPRNNEPAIPRIPGVRNIEEGRDPRVEFANWITSAENSYFPTVMANRLWRAMFGRGLVEPTNDLRETNPASHPELLKQLADAFVQNRYRLRPMLKLMVMSQTYGRSSKPIAGNETDNRFYSHSLRRPLIAEVLMDALADVTDVSNRFANHDDPTRAVQMTDAIAPSPELDILGRCSLAKKCDENSTTKGGLSAQLHLLNGTLLNEKLVTSDGRLQRMLANGANDQEIIRDFFVRALGRTPTSEELTKWDEKVRNEPPLSRQQDLEDFVWSMLSSKAFMENH